MSELAEPSAAPDCQKRPLMPRSRFQQQVSANVRLPRTGSGRQAGLAQGLGAAPECGSGQGGVTHRQGNSTRQSLAGPGGRTQSVYGQDTCKNRELK
jgi:hypothetical protein